MRRPGLVGRPVIIGGGPKERGNVVDCSEEAEALGIRPGMLLREALYLCPDALLIPLADGYGRIWEDILFAIGAFTLRIEPEAPGIAYLDMTKVLRTNGDEKGLASAITRGIRCSSRMKMTIGVGNSRFIAKHAALCAFDALVIEPGGEKEFLSLLPIDALPLGKKEKEHLRFLGLSTIKKVSAFSKKELISQFGRQGTALFDAAQGVDEKRPILRRQNPLCLEKEFSPDVSLDTSGEMLAIMEDMILGLSDELRRMRMTCRKMEITLFLQSGNPVEKALVIKKPTHEAKAMAARLLGVLEGLALESPVVSLKVSIPDPAFAQGDQEGLFRRKSLFLERLEGVKAYLQARYGHTSLVTVEEGDRHARLPERRFRFVDV